MPAVLGLILIIGLTVPLTIWLGRQERVNLAATPWDLADVARRVVPLISGQAAISVTAIVLLVTLVRGESASDSQAYDTVLTMFLVAFISFVGLAIQMIFLPLEGGAEGSLLPRILSTIAGAATLGMQAILPVLYRRRPDAGWIEPFGRGYVLFDLQATVVVIALLWRSLLQSY